MIAVLLVFAAGLFALGCLRLRWRVRSGDVLRFGAALALLAIALLSPLHEAGEHSLAAHMLEHELLMLAAAPLLVAAHPLGIMLWAFPPRARHALGALVRTRAFARVWRGLSAPLIATVLQALALWLWHAPRLFDLAMAHEGWHIAQHATFLATALLFWKAILGGAVRKTPLTAIGCLFATALVGTALGALMALSASPWYAAYRALQFSAFGFTPEQDQQLAGVLMWVPGGLVHMGVALALLGRLLRRSADGYSHAGRSA